MIKKKPKVLKKKVGGKKKDGPKPQKKPAPRKTIKEARIANRQAEMKKRKKKRRGVVQEENIQELIEKSRQRGFVTYSEILYAFPDIEKDVEGLERLYLRLEEEGMQVEEVREYLDVETSDEEKRAFTGGVRRTLGSCANVSERNREDKLCDSRAGT